MKKFKKLFLSLGTVAAVAAPIAAVVSCGGETKTAEEQTLSQKVKAINIYFTYLQDKTADADTKKNAGDYLELLLSQDQTGGPLDAAFSLKVSNTQKLLIANIDKFNYKATLGKSNFGASEIRISATAKDPKPTIDKKAGGGVMAARISNKVIGNYEFRFTYANNNLVQESAFAGNNALTFLAPKFNVAGTNRSFAKLDFTFITDNMFYANKFMTKVDFTHEFYIVTLTHPGHTLARTNTLPSDMDTDDMLDAFEANSKNEGHKVLRDRFVFTPDNVKGEMKLEIKDYTVPGVTVILKGFKTGPASVAKADTK